MAPSLRIFQMVFIMMLMHSSRSKSAGYKTDIGVVYGTLGNDLPSHTDAIGLYNKQGIAKIKLDRPNKLILDALRGENILVSMVVPYSIKEMATNLDFAQAWYSQFLEPYYKDVNFTYIIIGNEAIPGNDTSPFVPFAMQNLQTILDYNELGYIRVTTAVSTQVLETTIPPSAASFTAEARDDLAKVVNFLQARNSVLMVNVYPYFDYADDPINNRLDFAQFTADEPVLTDDNLNYTNLYDATLDAFFWAMERAGGADVKLVVGETGWPSAGNGNVTTPALASTYNNNLVKHVSRNPGTPKRPGPVEIEAFIFSMFDEHLEPTRQRRNFGIFKTNLEPVYPLSFN